MLINGTTNARVMVCKRCGRIFKGKRWVRANGEPQGTLTTCEDCGRHPETHNAILQVNGINPEAVEKLIFRELKESQQRGEVENVFEKGGKYHFTEKSMARAVAAELKRMGAETRETSKIVTYDRQRSRQKTRITIRAVFKVAPGDVIKYRNGLFLVTGIDRGFVSTREGKKIRLKDVEKARVKRVEGFYISEKPPLVFVEATGETIEVPETGKGRVQVIKSGGRTWTLPL
jgi:NMD protein affecting ribosome stability and mRNA decay